MKVRTPTAPNPQTALKDFQADSCLNKPPHTRKPNQTRISYCDLQSPNIPKPHITGGFPFSATVRNITARLETGSITETCHLALWSTWNGNQSKYCRCALHHLPHLWQLNLPSYPIVPFGPSCRACASLHTPPLPLPAPPLRHGLCVISDNGPHRVQGLARQVVAQIAAGAWWWGGMGQV